MNQTNPGAEPPVINAFVDAIRPLDIQATNMPMTPGRLVELVAEARTKSTR